MGADTTPGIELALDVVTSNTSHPWPPDTLNVDYPTTPE